VTNTSQQQEEELNKSVQEEELNKSMQEEELNKSVAAPARPLTLTRRAKTLIPRSQKLQRQHGNPRDLREVKVHEHLLRKKKW
jgi:hypothetical protein